jgi:hypothetical protein
LEWRHAKKVCPVNEEVPFPTEEINPAFSSTTQLTMFFLGVSNEYQRKKEKIYRKKY